MGAVADEEVGDIVAFAGASKVEGIGDLGLGPVDRAKQCFDHTVEAGVNGFVEQREIFAGAFGYTSALSGFERILKREELASLDEIQELFKVLRQGSVANGHLHGILRAAAWTWQGGIARRPSLWGLTKRGKGVGPLAIVAVTIDSMKLRGVILFKQRGEPVFRNHWWLMCCEKLPNWHQKR